MSKYAKKVNRCLIAIRRGDETQFRRLFDLTFNHLSVVAKVYLRNKSYCDDVVMETYERVLKYINSFSAEKDGYNWLCQIAKRVAFAFNAQNKVFDNASEIENTGGEDFFDITNQNIDLNNVIDKMPPEDKTIIISYFYLDMTYEEIGQKIGKTKSAVHKKLKKILSTLKNYLQDGNFD